MTPDAAPTFLPPQNLHHEIYPAIDARLTPLSQPGKAVLITGAGRGIGRAIALQYAQAGVGVLILCARTGSELEEVESAVGEIDGGVRVWKEVLDVLDVAGVAELAGRVRREVGRLDVLVNNAGVSNRWARLGETGVEEWWRVLEVNVKGPLVMMHAFLPLLMETAEERRAHVDVGNVTSIGALTVVPGASAYAVGKLALQRMSEFVAVEYGGERVNVVGIHPGGVETKLASGVEEVKPCKFLDLVAKRFLESEFLTFLIDLIDTPELCGGFVVWLTSQDREWLNGRYVERIKQVRVKMLTVQQVRVCHVGRGCAGEYER